MIRYGDQRADKAVMESLQKEERQASASMSLLVQQALFTTTASLQYLVSLLERNLAESAPVEGVAQTLLDFSKAHPAFDQLRYLNTEGYEAVRVDAAKDGSVIVESAELQDKSSRTYFRRAVELPRGKVVVFPVEFNQERGVI